MVFHKMPYRLAVLVGFIVVAWLLVAVGVLPADVAASASFIVILCALAPTAGRLGRNQDRSD
jgi:hypothetical protein